MSAPKSWIVRLAYIVGLLALVEGVAFAMVRHLDNDLGNRSERHVYAALRSHALNPDYQRDFDTGGRRLHSDQGFRRDGVVERVKPANTLRIFMLGGSALYGLGVQSDPYYAAQPTLANDETVSFFLEQLLSERLRAKGYDLQVEVINAGVTAYQTFQHVLYLYESLYEYDPDLVIFLDGHNDFYNVDAANPLQSYRYSAATLIPALNDRRPWLASHLVLRPLGQYSYTAKLLEKTTYKLYQRFEEGAANSAQSTRLPEGDFVSALTAAAELGFLRSYRLVETLADVHGFDFHVFLQPEVVFEDDQVLVGADLAIKEITERLYGAGRVGVMRRARPLFPTLFADHGIGFTDIGAIAGTAPGAQLYMDYTHLMPAGSEQVARRMLPVVLELAIARMGAQGIALSGAGGGRG